MIPTPNNNNHYHKNSRRDPACRPAPTSRAVMRARRPTATPTTACRRRPRPRAWHRRRSDTACRPRPRTIRPTTPHTHHHHHHPSPCTSPPRRRRYSPPTPCSSSSSAPGAARTRAPWALEKLATALAAGGWTSYLIRRRPSPLRSCLSRSWTGSRAGRMPSWTPARGTSRSSAAGSCRWRTRNCRAGGKILDNEGEEFVLLVYLTLEADKGRWNR